MPPIDRPWENTGQMGRRRFLKLMSTSMALLGLSGCARFRAPSEALPYVHPPSEVMPGERDFYATTLPFRGYGRGVVVECVMGRPVKVDGHPEHPSTLGGSDAALQACLLELYDPDRLLTITRNHKPASRTQLEAFLLEQAPRISRARGEGVHIVSPPLHSPSLEKLIESTLPQATWHRVEAFSEGPVRHHYNLEQADLVVSLGLEFLGNHPDSLRLARDFSKRRNPENMSQIWSYDCRPTLTTVAADHHRVLTPHEQQALLQRLLAGNPEGEDESRLLSLLQQQSGRCLVMGGPAVDPSLVHRLNEKLGNLGKTVTYSFHDRPVGSLRDLRVALDWGKVEWLITFDCDPCYLSGDTLPLEKASNSIHLHHRPNLTAQRSDWVVPGLHPLERWGDLRSFDGTTSLSQPVIEPPAIGWSSYKLLGSLTGAVVSDLEYVKSYWTDLNKNWPQSLSSGIVARQGFPESAFVETEFLQSKEGQQVAFSPDPYLYDGRHTNNPWLLELPRPITRLAWNNAVIVNEDWARKQGYSEGDHIVLKTQHGQLEAPIFLSKNQASGVFGVSTGWGQEEAGRFGSGQGYDAYPLRGASEVSFLSVEIEKSANHTILISTQHQQKMEGRDLVRRGTLQQWGKDPTLDIEPPPEESIYPEKLESPERRWGMVIDLSKCIGCNACTAACGSENNLAVVGPEETSKGRAMHWLRVDHYEEPESAFQPVPCMHCENAPCEQVCPVEATLHNKEGLNQMIYNRCVGTRYCLNNCPYKVRRFNFLDYTHPDIDEWDNVRNPEVTVRSRGVMEKCTYCVQRIEAADIRSRIEERKIEDGEVITACQTACPTRAIVFGDLNDPESEVAKQAALPHNYGLLAELNTRPRTTYLARISHQESER